MSRAFILLFFILPTAVFASSHIAEFVFITEPRVVAIGEISEEIKIQAQDSLGNAVAPGETVDLELSSTSSSGEFLNSSGSPASKVWNSNWKNRSFYYRDSTAGAHTLKIKATGRESEKSWTATQQITVSGAGVENQIESLSENNTSSPLPANSSVTAVSVTPSIKAYAGEDKTAVVGSSLEFLGSATGLKGEPLNNARFFWNFGDGETKEGRSISHIFRIPGKYTVGLHVSSGEYAASDYLAVEVVPNQITIASVLLGEGGYVKFYNPSVFEVDIGGWALEDSTGKKFYLPPKTKIGAKTEIAFDNGITGLLKTASDLPLYFSYPNLSVHLEWNNTPKVSEANMSSADLPAVKKSSDQAMDKKIKPSAPTYKEIDETTENKTNSAEVKKEVIASAGFSKSSIFFAASVMFGLIAGLGFIVLKKFLVF